MSGKQKQEHRASLQKVTNIIKPKNDIREYRGLVLPNQLKVMLVSDPTTDKSAGALSVGVGSLSDPWEMQGMAHFLEHALFLTTKKYPEENFFKNFVVSHGGHTNAFTSMTETCYYFDVAPNELGGALDRFAQFFVEPLFPRNLIERELQSVQFEFENTINSNGHRFYRVRKMSCLEKHEFSKFDIGNRDTLKVNDALFNSMVKFFETWYSANLMTLSVLGKESLDQLEGLVVPLFGQIINRNTKPPWIERHPFSGSAARRMSKIVPFQETRKMIIFFPLPDFQRDLPKCDALTYITFLLGHEGPGSLLAELKAQGYSTVLDVAYYYYAGFGFLDIEVNLTQGINCNDQIITLLFQYIKMLKTSPPQKRIYDEIKQVDQIKFNFRDKFDPMPFVKFMCSNMHFYPMERALSGHALMGEFDPQLIMNILTCLSPETLNLQVISPIFKTQNIKLIKDPIYSVEYTIEPIPRASIENWNKCQLNPNLQLPAPNEFIPRNFTLLSGGPKPNKNQKDKDQNKNAPNEEEHPKLVYNKEQLRVWHLQDSKYHVPKAFYGFAFKSPLVNSTPININLVSLFGKLFFDHICQKFYTSDLVGIHYNFATNRFGLEVLAQGFNDKLDTFTLELITELVNFTIQPNRYTIMRDLFYNALKVYNQHPIQTLLNTNIDSLIMPNLWGCQELLDVYPQINGDSILALMRDIFSNCQIEAFCHGNINKADAIALSQKVMQIVTSGQKLSPINLYYIFDQNRDVQCPVGISELSLTHEQHENHGFIMYHQLGMQDMKTLARTELLHQLIKEPYFNQIRMAEQLAYVTFVTLKISNSGSIGLCFLIQSAYSLRYLESRLEAFIESLGNILEHCKGDEYQKEMNALITKLTEKPKSMFGLSSKYWHEITSCQYIFDREIQLVSHLKKTKLSEIIALYRSTLRTGASKCRRVIVTIKSAKCKEMQGKEVNQSNKDKNPKDAKHKQQAVPNKGPQKAPPSNSSSSPKKKGPRELPESKSNESKESASETAAFRRLPITNIRKFKCENALCPIPKVLLDRI